MRLLIRIGLLLCLSTSSGCMVMEELDNAAAKMPNTKTSKASEADAKAQGTAATASARAKANALIRKSQRWWGGATSLAPTNLESSIVSCRLRGATQFMSRDDCLSRGGTPRNVSG